MAQLIRIWCFLTTIQAFSSAKSVQSVHSFEIMGGELASITELPHQVYINLRNYGLLCGGSIISSQHILTGRYCVDDDKENYKVVAATDDRAIGGEEYAIAEITTHPNVSGIAVVKLAKEIKFSDKAKPIALAEPEYRIKDGAELIASGWGIYNGDSVRSNKLRKVSISKVSDEKCKNTFSFVHLPQEFCAGGEGKNACLYDDGGPLIAKTRNGNVLVGVTRLGACSSEFRFSIFANVSQINKWIKEVVKPDLQSNE